MSNRFSLLFVLAAELLRANDSDLFERRIRPLLANQCYSCHGPEKQFGALRLDSRERILRGGANGPAAVPGQPGDSLLMKAVRHQGPKMPMGGKLKAEEISALEQWIAAGLPWPQDNNIKLAAGDPGFYQKLIREHWAFQPLKRPPIPASSGNTPIDRFIVEKLRASRLAPADRADKHTLARRAAFVLTGLPPEPAAVHTFLNDSAPGAYERYIDGLLASPHFGERWARHWMDLMRYAETYGYEWNFEIHNAWRYRDYLIRAFNEDLPYDQFVREHIAGDLLTKPRTRDNGRWNESVLATAFYRLGEMGHDNCNQFPEIRTDVVDNQIDTLTKAFQGLTVSCARCHDHKIDPIPTEDYYALYGILNSSRPVTRTLDLSGPPEPQQRKLVELRGQIRKSLAQAWLAETNHLGRNLAAALAWEKDAPDAADIAAGLDYARVTQLRKLLRRTSTDHADPLYPASSWMNNGSEWSRLSDVYATESAVREKFNNEKFVVFGDFREELPAGWTADGWGFRTGRAKNGDFAVATEGGDAITGVFPAGLYSNLLSDKLNAVIRSPLLPKDKKFITLEVAGDKLGAYRLVMDGCVIGEDHQLLKNPRLHWERTSSKSDQPLPTYLELVTKSDNPRLPERPEKFKGLTEEEFASPRSFWGITRVLLHDEAVEPRRSLSHMHRLVNAPAPRNGREMGVSFQAVVQDAIRKWSEGVATADDVVWLDWLLQNEIVTNSRNLSSELRRLTDRYREIESSLANPAVVYSMADIDKGEDFPILAGGQARSPGRPAPRHFLSLMPESLRNVRTEQSGRRELAEAMASEKNPLTARVMVNRIWHHVFGRGLVSSTDNFGRYGDTPTHPELLDYLAAEFIADGWSIKKTIRRMLLSNVFQQSSVAPEKSAAADPQNLLWHRYPVRRLEAEAVRDSILAVSGKLDRQLFGESIQPHREQPTEYRRLFRGPLDGRGRRSIYLKVTRMEGPRFLEIFDFPPPMQTRGNRDVTNVPSQSLALLNDPFVIAQAEAWAAQLVRTRDDAVDARIGRMFNAALGRPAKDEELTRLRALVDSLAAERSLTGPAVLTDTGIWKDVAHTFFNMKEFVYIR